MRLTESVYFYPSSPGRGWDEEEINANTIVIDGPAPILIDPGLSRRWPSLKAKLAADGLDPGRIRLIIGTHGHPDHIEAGSMAAQECGALMLISEKEADFIEGEGDCFFKESGSQRPPRPSAFLAAGRLRFGGHELWVYPTPGHSPGGISLHFPAEKVLVTGDLYFEGTIGAIDYAGGCPADMYASVEAIQKLEAVETVLCGHGPAIIGRSLVADNYQQLNEEIAQKKAAGIF
jgi:Zn-dependent hydrolases, including glyoxylases